MLVKNLIISNGNFQTKPLNFVISYGEKIRISGMNGAGKTSLLETLVNNESCWGENIKMFYLPQTIKPKPETVANYIKNKLETDNLADIRKILARLNFDDSLIYTKHCNLSAGENSRLELGIMAYNNPNLIILDEPSNHLDLEALEALEKFLQNYEGTLIYVSHDNKFVEKVGFDKEINL